MLFPLLPGILPSNGEDDGMHPDELTIGQRIQHLRERQGKSTSWLKAVESGRLQPPRLPVLLKIAEVLGVRDVAELLGDQRVPESVSAGPGHPALPAVRDAITAVNLGPVDAAPSVAEMRARLDTAWAVRHASPNHRTALGELLPALILDADAAVRAAEGRERRAGYAVLAEVMNLAQMFVAYQPDSVLLWRTAERALSAARESGDPYAISGAVWFLNQVHRDAGEWDQSTAVVREGIAMLDPLMPDAGPDVRAMWGALQFEAAYTAARVGEQGTAWYHWDEADRAARTLPIDYFQPWTSFSRVIMGAHATTIPVELRQGGEAVRQADRTDAAAIQSHPRRARHIVEAARGHHLRNDHAATLALLTQAYDAAPETIRYNGPARTMLAELTEDPGLSREAHALSERVGILR